MSNENPNLKLLSISVIYILSTVFMWMLSKNNESTSLGYLFILVIIWAILTIVVGFIIWKDRIKIKKWNILILIFCTPIPFLCFLSATSKEQVRGTWEYNKNNHRIKEISYENRKEYSSSVDETTEEYPIPANEKYHLDSIVYYGKNSKIIETKHFK
ncbi:hypothetical protein [Flavobacterium aquicola]|uniref:Uncharacterized protein n=1 Tax=Flavobacterium aquicola TaxID=1682742 RepID=A0A3E0DVB7_9FLAO|nr:hypothetical protein [Flavobacterium aquicola]REG88537.1 hypothetical protein C8P67_1372 [Flavobacterium aquicola]